MTSWGDFAIGDIFDICKPSVYHSYEVKEMTDGIPYVVRSKYNNGVKCRVEKRDNIRPNPSGVISFGSENSSFFYQSEIWCSGRDIYYIDTRDLSVNSCMFLISCLRHIGAKYSYNFGLFPDLLRKEIIKLPITVEGRPDWGFMNDFIKQLEISSTLAWLKRTDSKKIV